MLLRANIGAVAVASVSNRLDREIDSGTISDTDELINVLATETRGIGGANDYSESDLVLTPSEYEQARTDFDASELSFVIQSLLALYQYDQARDVYHFPGTIVKRTSDQELTVLVPLTGGSDSNKLQIISQWSKPIELTYLGRDRMLGGSSRN